MNMKQYEDIHYEHSADTYDEARAKSQGKEYKPKALAEKENLNKEELKQKLDAGEISEAEYRTLTEPSSLGENIDFVDMDVQEEEEEIEKKPSYAKDDTYWSNQLTQEDIDYLLLK